MGNTMKHILTIAGSDSGGGAGIQADLKTITMLRGYGASVITSITAQNTMGVEGVYDVPLDGIAAQFDAVCKDISFSGVKTGMLSSKEIVSLVCDKLEIYQLPNLVVDPVMVSTSGHMLLQPDAVNLVRERLLPLAVLATPNLKEAEVLADMSIHNLDDMKKAGQCIQKELNCANVLVKGGHLDDAAIDLLCTVDGRFIPFREERIDTKNSHGTGCTLSAALATCLGRGMALEDAVAAAKQYLTKALYYGQFDHIGHGAGPVRHNYSLFETEQA